MKRDLALTLICAVALLAGFAADRTEVLSGEAATLFYIISYLAGGYYGAVGTLKDLKRREINIDFLMLLAAIGAAIIGQWLEGGILLFLFSLSGSLEGLALDKSRRAIHTLMELRPDRALVRREDGTEVEVAVESLEIGQVVVVRPGERIPIDGMISEGRTSVDQSAITGESIPVTLQEGDEVYAATMNRDGVIEIRVTRTASESTLSRIIQLVERAQSTRAKTQRFLDRFEPRYAIGVIVLVILLIVTPWLLLGHEFEPTFYRAITVLVVASPCALIISTPASIISAIANAARNGILFKGGSHLEQAAVIDTIALDKTGTLTLGKPAVTDIEPVSSVAGESALSGEELLKIATACERYSEHHLAEAIVKHCREQGLEPYSADDLTFLPGLGVSGRVQGMRILIGNRMLHEKSFESWPDDVLAAAQRLQKEGKTVVYVAEEGRPIGLIALADQIRPAARDALQRLRKLGISRIVMLTGDHEVVANQIAGKLGIDTVHSELLPEEKVECIRQLTETGRVAMIGDGVNDAPALASSHLGIAMGGAGTDVALETADVVLMGDNLEKLPYLFSLSRRAGSVVRQNIAFSLAVILLLLAGVFLIDLPLTAGVIGHEGSTLLVVLNGLRLLGGKP
ncbi:MAG: heavy metal translocating P-type ATPase [Balneolaceae bacterium]